MRITNQCSSSFDNLISSTLILAQRISSIFGFIAYFSVAQGVKYFKDGRNTEALQCYNFAIEVENTNPDAYVARGAL